MCLFYIPIGVPNKKDSTLWCYPFLFLERDNCALELEEGIVIGFFKKIDGRLIAEQDDAVGVGCGFFERDIAHSDFNQLCSGALGIQNHEITHYTLNSFLHILANEREIVCFIYVFYLSNYRRKGQKLVDCGVFIQGVTGYNFTLYEQTMIL